MKKTPKKKVWIVRDKFKNTISEDSSYDKAISKAIMSIVSPVPKDITFWMLLEREGYTVKSY